MILSILEVYMRNYQDQLTYWVIKKTVSMFHIFAYNYDLITHKKYIGLLNDIYVNVCFQ